MRMARGSLYELLDHLVVAVDNDYMDQDDSKKYQDRVESGLKLLNGYVRYLRTRAESGDKNRLTSEPVNQ